MHHLAAHEWFAAEGSASFASCPLTQNAVLRILGNPRYPRSLGTPWSVVTSLTSLIRADGHEFWPEGISLLDSEWVWPEQLISYARLTDDYLLALASSRGAQLATLDRKLRSDAVKGGRSALRLLI